MLNRMINLLNEWAVKENDGIDAESIAKFLIENNVVILPCAIGIKVWCLAQPCGGCPCYNEPVTEESINRCQRCKEWEIGQCDFDYELIPEFGKLVFATKEEAENKLKELMENESI